MEYLETTFDNKPAWFFEATYDSQITKNKVNIIVFTKDCKYLVKKNNYKVYSKCPSNNMTFYAPRSRVVAQMQLNELVPGRRYIFKLTRINKGGKLVLSEIFKV